MKRIKKITGIVLIITAIALPVFAWGPGFGIGFGPGPCRNCDNCGKPLTAEEQEKMGALSKGFEDKTSGVRDEIIKKQIDLNAVIESDEPDLNKAKAIQKDINELQAKIIDAHLEFIIEAKKINPEMGFGRGSGMGKGMRAGRGMGRGM